MAVLLPLLMAAAAASGCIGGLEEDGAPSTADALSVEPTGSGQEASSQAASEDGNGSSNASLVSDTQRYDTTLEWTHVRYGMYDNVVVRGGNCIFVNEVPPTMEVHTVTVLANWTGDAIKERGFLELQVRSEHVGPPYYVERKLVLPHLNLSLEGWDQTAELFNYGSIGFFPNDDHPPEALVEMRVEASVIVDYTVPEEDHDELLIRDGSCT